MTSRGAKAKTDFKKHFQAQWPIKDIHENVLNFKQGPFKAYTEQNVIIPSLKQLIVKFVVVSGKVCCGAPSVVGKAH